MLTLAPRVCKQWHDLSKSSINIRRALFFKPLLADHRIVRFNPFVDKIMTDWYHRKGSKIAVNEAVRCNMLITNPPKPVRSMKQHELEDWILYGGKGGFADISNHHKGSKTTKELAMNAEVTLSALRCISWADYRDARYHRQGCLALEMTDAWKRCDSGTTGWDVLLDR